MNRKTTPGSWRLHGIWSFWNNCLFQKQFCLNLYNTPNWLSGNKNPKNTVSPFPSQKRGNTTYRIRPLRCTPFLYRNNLSYWISVSFFCAKLQKKYKIKSLVIPKLQKSFAESLFKANESFLSSCFYYTHDSIYLYFNSVSILFHSEK